MSAKKRCGDFGGLTTKGKPCGRHSFDGGMCGEHRGQWKAGRPKREIDQDAVRRLAEIGCTYEEMAFILACHRTTLAERFGDVVGAGRAKTHASLRRAQLKLALGSVDTAPNPTMQIWLGKQMLGQRDKHELAGADGGPLSIQAAVRAMSDKELAALASLLAVPAREKGEER